MKYRNLLFVIVVSIGSLAGLSAQKQIAGSINEGTIGEQFDYLIKKSSNWNDGKGQSYEVIKRNMLFTLKSHATDTIQSIRAKLETAHNVINTQKDEISTLQSNLEQAQSSLESTVKEKNSMTFLGIQMSKGGYKFLIWSIIAALTAALAFFIFRFKNSHVLTREAKDRLVKVEREFNEHKKNTLEKEQKIKRQLQDEINKRKG